MSSFISEERSAVKFMIAIIGFEFAIALIFGTGLPIAYYQNLQQLLVRQEMGIAALQTLLHLTSHLYTLIFIQTGLAHAMTPAPPPTHQVADLSLTEKLSWAARGRILTILAIFYIAIFRVLVFFTWAIALIPLVIAAAYDGWVQRKVAQFRFVYQSGQKHFVGNRASKIITYGLLLIFFLPIPIPPIAIIFWAVFLGLFSYLWMRNMPKRI
jgi:hypothetical protein